MRPFTMNRLAGIALCWICAVAPLRAVALQVQDVSEILDLFDSSAPNGSTIRMAIHKSLDAGGLTRGEEQQVLRRIVLWFSDEDQDRRYIALDLAMVFGVRRPGAVDRILTAAESSGYPVMIMSLLDLSHRFSDDGVVLDFFERVARQNGEGMMSERAVGRLAERGEAGRARLRQLDREGLIVDPRAKRLVERLRKEGKLGG
jgi:hypothetical protein